jgi:hypothetical protein
MKMHECEKKGLTKKAFCKCLITKGAFVVWLKVHKKEKQPTRAAFREFAVLV